MLLKFYYSAFLVADYLPDKLVLVYGLNQIIQFFVQEWQTSSRCDIVHHWMFLNLVLIYLFRL